VAKQKLTLPSDRAERLQYMRRMFPLASGPFLGDDWVGGRAQALKRLNTIDPVAYDRNRNFINGAVTKLSPYIRYGCISINEAISNVNTRFGSRAKKLIMEFAWHDFFRQVWYAQGNAIFSDLEAPKVVLGRKPLPDFIKQGITGLPCMDGIVRDLTQVGYVHNHSRMWFAAYVTHWLKADWREAADWFESLLIDGNKASNHLSWQWVASSFSSKPYYFNKENLARFSGEKYCASCRVKCPFDDTYENLEMQLFDRLAFNEAKNYPVMMPAKAAISPHQAVAIYVHDEMLSVTNALVQQSFSKYFIFDPNVYGQWPLNRLQFVADCLSEMQGVEVWVGDTRAVLQELGIGKIISQDTPNLATKSLLAPFNPTWEPQEKLTNATLSEKRLQRFSRYWEKVEPTLLSS
jgi:deoxyribodipyrimidine photo-lyase